MQAYHLEIPDKDYALVLLVDGDEQQIYSGDPENMSWLVKLLNCPVVTLRSEMVPNPSWDEDDLPGERRKWFRENDEELPLSSLLFQRATIGI